MQPGGGNNYPFYGMGAGVMENKRNYPPPMAPNGANFNNNLYNPMMPSNPSDIYSNFNMKRSSDFDLPSM
jgi:hypothetical protein